jgi:phosphoenolpyruvate phosphomutase
LKRAEAYYQAGADAILIHSKQAVADEILAFMNAWHNRIPVVIVPTTYYRTPTVAFREAGFSMVIWANHLLRASITTMQQTAAAIYAAESIASVEEQIASIKEVFYLQSADELKAAEKRYLPPVESSVPVKTY